MIRIAKFTLHFQYSSLCIYCQVDFAKHLQIVVLIFVTDLTITIKVVELFCDKEKDQQSWPRVIDKISIYRSIFLYLAVVYPVILISGMFHSPGVLTVHSIISPSSFFAENANLPISSFPVILSSLGT